MEIIGKRYCDLGDNDLELQFFIKNDEKIICRSSFHPFDKDWKLQRFIDLNLPPYTHTNIESIIYLPSINQFVIQCFTHLQIDEFDDERKRFLNSDFVPTNEDFRYREKEVQGSTSELSELDMKKHVWEEGNFVMASIEIGSNDERLIEDQFQSMDLDAEQCFNPHSPFQVKRLHGISYDVQEKAFIYTAKFPKRKLKNFIQAGFEMK